MKLIRRTHLYTGLFLAPWVAMYGISGLIFNHGSWFSASNLDPAFQPIEWMVEVAAMPVWPEPDALAQRVITALNTVAKDKTGREAYRLSTIGKPRYQGGVGLQGQDETGGSVVLSFDRRGLKGPTSHSPPRPQVEQIKLEINDAELLNASRDAMLAASIKADPKSHATKWIGDGDFPHLSFLVVHGSERRVATYDLRSGLVRLSPEQSMRWPNFLTSLHVSHGYPSVAKSEKVMTVRAVFVDTMAILMCFWAASGIAMWLQIKQLRRLGLMVAIASLVVTGLIWSAMYQLFTGN